ncbi:flavodoxin family protein [Thermoplasmatota archaeon]
MKIIAINGSPHKGNTTDKILDIQQKLKKHDDVDFEIINLKDIDIQPCKGCFLCFIRGDDSCPLKDDREKIIKKIDEADGVIFATPVYSMHVSYLMKLLIDRFSCTFHRPRYFGKYAITIAVSANLGLKETSNYLKMVLTTWGFNYIGGLKYRSAPKNTPMKIPPLKKDRTDVIVEDFHNSIKMRKPQRLTISDYLTFRLMQVVYKQMETMSPYDYKYWNEKGWFEKDKKYFFENVKHNIFKDAFARLFTWIFKRQMEKEFNKN